MIYNSNGNNTPYQSGGNAKVQKELKALEEAINNVTANFNDYVDDNNADITRIENNISAIDTTVSGLGTRLSQAEDTIAQLPTQVTTQKVVAEDADFHTVKAGKYTFQNGTQITGSNICKLAEGSVVYATDGTNSILVDYTANDAWVAKAKATNDSKFKIYQDGTLAFTESRGWTVYVLGNTFTLDGEASGTPVEIETGITIGGTLYAALARDYAFDNLTATNATFGIAGIDHVTISESTVQTQQTGTETVGTLTADAATINNLKAAKRDIQDIVNGAVQISAHPTNVACYIGIPKFTGTYQIKLDGQDINGNPITQLTATIVWNGKDPIVQYNEYSDDSERDYLYKIVLTNDALYFVTQGAGTLYYSYDAFGGASAPVSALFPNIPYSENDIICEYITAYPNRTVFLGDRTQVSGVDVLGELAPDIFKLPSELRAESLTVENTLHVMGESTFDNDITVTGDLTQTGNQNVTGDITATGKIEGDELVGKSLEISETETVVDPDTQEESQVKHTYLEADNTGITLNGDTTLTGDLTQSGDQNITGEVTISEKEIINSLEAVTSGHYETVNYFYIEELEKYYKGQSTSAFVEATPDGTQISSSPRSKCVVYNGDIVGLSSNTYVYVKITSTGDCYLRNNTVYTPNPNEWTYDTVNYDNYHYYKYYVPQETDTTIATNRIYAKKNGTYYYITGDSLNASFVEETLPDCINYLSTKTFVDGDLLKDKRYRTVDIEYSASGYVDGYTPLSFTSEQMAEIQALPIYNIRYTPYKEFVQEADPTHTYDSADEVLTVKGNERITRDLHVQGYIFQDDYHTAFLPSVHTDNIASTSGNINIGSVVIIGDLD